MFFAYLYDVVQEEAGRAQGPCSLFPVPGSESVLVLRAILFSISDILTFRVSASTNYDALVSISFLRVSLTS